MCTYQAQSIAIPSSRNIEYSNHENGSPSSASGSTNTGLRTSSSSLKASAPTGAYSGSVVDFPKRARSRSIALVSSPIVAGRCPRGELFDVIASVAGGVRRRYQDGWPCIGI